MLTQYTKRFMYLCMSSICLFVLIGCENTESLRNGMQLKSTANNNDAIQQFQAFIDKYPQSKRIPAIREEIADSYFQIAENEKQLKHWQKGVDFLQTIIDKYGETKVAMKVEDIEPEYLYEWSNQLSGEGNFIEALKIIKRLIQNFPASNYAQVGRDLRQEIGIMAFSSGSDVYVMNADGSKLRKVEDMATDPTISPDGKKIAYIKIQKPGERVGYLYLSDIDGRRAQQLLDNPVASEPRFSPDGTNILIRKGDSFQKVDLSGRTINAYFDIPDFDTIGSFNPKGSAVVAFLKKPAKDGVSRLIVTENFEEYTELTSTKDDPIRDAAWARDDLRIVYVTSKGLHTISPNGEDQQDFLLSDQMEGMEIHSVDMSPNGTNIIFLGKKASETQYRLYHVNLNRDFAPLEYEPMKDGQLPLPTIGRISWGQGYLQY